MLILPNGIKLKNRMEVHLDFTDGVSVRGFIKSVQVSLDEYAYYINYPYGQHGLQTLSREIGVFDSTTGTSRISDGVIVDSIYIISQDNPFEHPKRPTPLSSKQKIEKVLEERKNPEPEKSKENFTRYKTSTSTSYTTSMPNFFRIPERDNNIIDERVRHERIGVDLIRAWVRPIEFNEQEEEE